MNSTAVVQLSYIHKLTEHYMMHQQSVVEFSPSAGLRTCHQIKFEPRLSSSFLRQFFFSTESVSKGDEERYGRLVRLAVGMGGSDRAGLAAPVVERFCKVHGCQMAIFRSYVLGPSGFWTMTPLCYAAKLDPFLSLDCAGVEGVGAQSNLAICQP